MVLKKKKGRSPTVRDLYRSPTGDKANYPYLKRNTVQLPIIQFSTKTLITLVETKGQKLLQ
jgi:hypothetical protein